jgi:hypothetical protein
MSAATADPSARRCALVPGAERGCNARGGAGMQRQTLGANPCARAARDASAFRRKNGSRHGANDWDGGDGGAVWGQGRYQGQGEVGIAVGVILDRRWVKGVMRVM